jgi:hypothetical protein
MFAWTPQKCPRKLTSNPSCMDYLALAISLRTLLLRTHWPQENGATDRHFKGECRCVSRDWRHPSTSFSSASGPIRFVLPYSLRLRCPSLIFSASEGRSGSAHTPGDLSSNLQTALPTWTGRFRCNVCDFLVPDVSYSLCSFFFPRLMFLSCLSNYSYFLLPCASYLIVWQKSIQIIRASCYCVSEDGAVYITHDKWLVFMVGGCWSFTIL